MTLVRRASVVRIPPLVRSSFALVLVLAALSPSVAGRAADRLTTASGEWPTYGGDLRSTRYSPLDQVSAANFDTLEVAWRFKTDNLGPRPEFTLQTTPLMIGGRLFFTAGTRRAAVALDAAAGELLWIHSINEGKRGELAARPLSGRGVAYWTDGRDERIFYVTPGYQLVGLDAASGGRLPSFGRSGIVDLKQDDDQEMDPTTADLGLHSAPIVVGDVIVIGAAHLVSGQPKSMRNVKGNIRGYDARSGRRLWIFHTIPRAGEYGNDTWENDSWSFTGNAGSWAQMSADPELGLVYVPVELPTGDYYGGHRPGAGLFGESVVALDVRTGARRWHYQLVHHGVWDMDIPCAPILADIVVDGRSIKALAQPTKQGWLYVLDRITGRPVWPIVERPVPAGDVPGEWYAPSQPHVTKPPAFERQGVTEDDLIDFTPALRAEALEIAKRYRLGPLFTPPALSTWPAPLATLMLPSDVGGANWPGGALDPATNIVYIFSMTQVAPLGLVPAAPGTSDVRFVQGRAPNPEAAGANAGRIPEGEPGGPLFVQGLPLIKPPYGRITAIDLDQGDIVWQVAHGETADNVGNHPALKGISIPRTGRTGRIGVLVTRTLVIAGDGGFFTTPSGRRGAMLRAYDKASGREVGSVYLPAPQTGSPSTYLINGRQYIVLSVSGAGYSGEVIAFRLPSAG